MSACRAKDHSRRRRSRRRAERGAAVFIVLLVLALLSALGLFAVRSAALASRAAGYNRQMVQTHYVTDYAVLGMAGELAGPRRQNYADEMWSQQHVGQCRDQESLTNPTCFVVFYSDLERAVQEYYPGAVLLVTPSVGMDGSLSPQPHPAMPLGSEVTIIGDMRIELTDIREAAQPVEGMDQTGEATSPKYYSITISADGQVRPDIGASMTTRQARTSSSLESSRAHMVIGPLVH